MSQYSHTRENRLLTAVDYARVFDTVENKASHRYVLILATCNNLKRNRLGIIVAKKNVRLAVQRNRFKRIAREVFRHSPTFRDGIDVVIMARRGVDHLDNRALTSILRQQWQKLTSQHQSPGV